MDLLNQVALVTGAASGLGEATARRLASHGAKVAVVDFNLEGASQVASSIGGTAYKADVGSEADVEQVFKSVIKDFGAAPRIVVNCAGIGLAARIVGREGKLATDMFERTLRVNLLGTYLMLSHGARAMQELDTIGDDNERGVIINTASVAIDDGQIGQAAYAASKGAIASLTLPAAREFSRMGVRVMTIAPGLFETTMTAGLPEDVRKAITSFVPYPNRLGKAEEYAQLVEQIVNNPYLNGTTIRLDGAVRLPPK